MNAIKHLLILSLGTILPAISNAQLKKDITVVHDYEPEYVEVTRLGTNPEITLPTDTLRALNYSTRKIGVNPTMQIAAFEPAAYADSIYTSPYRGYAALGFMPGFNLGASAGYKFLDTDRTRLNAWLQYDGTSYRGKYDDISRRMRRNTATLGANLHRATGRESYVDLGIDYTYSRFNTPVAEELRNQNVHRLNLSALWSGRNDSWRYGIGAGYSHFGYGNSLASTPQFPGPDLLKAVRENSLNASAFASTSLSRGSTAGMTIDFSLITNGNHAVTYTGQGAPLTLLPDGSLNHSRLGFNPYYRFDVDKFHLDLGAQIDFTFNSGSFFHIAPKVSATWTPGKYIKVYAKAHGGRHQNTLGSLFEVTPYSLPVMAYDNSSVPVNATIGITAGTWRGLYLDINATYAIANDWLMPVQFAGGTIFGHLDFKGYKLGITAGYTYRDIISLTFAYETAPHKYNRGFYLWRDRARHVADASLKVTPAKALDITVGWNYRGSRAVALDTAVQLPDGTFENRTSLSGLGAVSDLYAGALYRIDSRWSVFVSGRNLMNHRHAMIGGIPAQGITGLAGVTYKF